LGIVRSKDASLDSHLLSRRMVLWLLGSCFWDWFAWWEKWALHGRDISFLFNFAGNVYTSVISGTVAQDDISTTNSRWYSPDLPPIHLISTPLALWKFQQYLYE
jgi:hypothetical protein